MESYKPHPYQERAIDWLVNTPAKAGGAGLFLDMGLGKTSCVLSAFKKLKSQGKAKRMLVVATLKAVQLTWPGEIRKWADFAGLSYSIIHGPNKLEALKKDVDIYLINYEGLSWLFDQKWVAPAVLCFDELYKMKSWKAKRVKEAIPYLGVFKYRWGLTGSPVSNGYHDVFSQTYMLDMGNLFGKYITHFEREYFYKNENTPFKFTPRRNAVAEIGDKLSSVFFRMDGKDWLDLPEEVHNPIKLDLPPDLRKKYDVLEEHFILTLENAIITAVSAAALSNKLRQFLSGNIYGEDRKVEHIHTLKLQALEELFAEQQGNPVLVGYQYNHELDALKAKFKDGVFLDTYKNLKALQDVVAQWNKGNIPYMFGHPASIGHGLNLQEACNTICFTSLDFNYDNYIQFLKRVSRQGQKEKHVIVHYLAFNRTLDWYLIKTLREKGDVQTSLLNYIKEVQSR